MSHMSQLELLGCVESFFTSLLGVETYRQWKELKQLMNFDSEKSFVSWILHTLTQQVDDGSSGEVFGDALVDHTLHQVTLADDGSVLTTTAGPPILLDPTSESHQILCGTLGGLEDGGGSTSHITTTPPTSTPTTSTSTPTGRRGSRRTKSAGGGGGQPSSHRSLRCLVCQGQFSSERELSKHKTIVHAGGADGGVGGASAPPKVFPCDLCEKMFLRLHHLKRHRIEVHLKLKSYQCSFCDAAFSRITRLNVHIGKSHSDQLPQHQQHHQQAGDVLITTTEVVPTSTHQQHLVQHHHQHVASSASQRQVNQQQEQYQKVLHPQQHQTVLVEKVE